MKQKPMSSQQQWLVTYKTGPINIPIWIEKGLSPTSLIQWLGALVQSAGCSSRGLGFNSQQPHRDSAICNSSSRGYETVFQTSQVPCIQVVCVYTCEHNNHTHKIKLKTEEKVNGRKDSMQTSKQEASVPSTSRRSKSSEKSVCTHNTSESWDRSVDGWGNIAHYPSWRFASFPQQPMETKESAKTWEM